MSEIILFIPEKAEKFLFKKIFGNSLFKQSLLYYHRHHQAQKIILHSPGRLISRFEKILTNDSDFRNLEVKMRVADGGGDLGAPLNRIYYGVDRYLDIVSEDDFRSIRSLLKKSILESCKTPVAKYINKKISLPLSSSLATGNISPNLITVIGLLFSLAGFFLLLKGFFAWAFVSFQINSILDGSDREVAKLNLQWSDLGKKLDVYGDYLTSFLIIAGEACGLYLLESSEWIFYTSVINILLLVLIGLIWIVSIIFRFVPKEFDDVESICHAELAGSKSFYAILFKASLFISGRDFYIFVLFACSLMGLHYFNHLFIGVVCLSWLVLSIYTLFILKRLSLNHSFVDSTKK